MKFFLLIAENLFDYWQDRFDELSSSLSSLLVKLMVGRQQTMPRERPCESVEGKLFGCYSDEIVVKFDALIGVVVGGVDVVVLLQQKQKR